MDNPLTTRPTTTFVWSAAAGAFTIILTWAMKQFADVDMPTDVGQAVTLLTTLLLAHILDSQNQ